MNNIRIDGDVVIGTSDFDPYGLSIDVYGLKSVRVPLAGESRADEDKPEAAEYQCEECGEPLYEDGMGQAVEYGTDEAALCPETEGPHKVRRIPLSWANAAAIVFDRENDAIRLQVSTDDPRGCMEFAIRMHVDEEGRQNLWLTFPESKGRGGHAELTDLGDNRFQIGRNPVMPGFAAPALDPSRSQL